MRALLIAVPLALAACSAPRPVAPAPAGLADGFDAVGWLVRARPYSESDSDRMIADEDDVTFVDPASDSVTVQEVNEAQAKLLSAELDAATGWVRACDTYWDPEAEAPVYDPVGPDGGHGLRGVYTVTDVGPGEAVVTVVCGYGAYQGTYALVHVQGDRAALLRAPSVDLEGRPFGPSEAVYSTPGLEDGSDRFETFAKGRGLADCGILSRYRIASLGEADLVEARARECDDRPEDAPPAEAWPVVFPRP